MYNYPRHGYLWRCMCYNGVFSRALVFGRGFGLVSYLFFVFSFNPVHSIPGLWSTQSVNRKASFI